MYPTFKLFSAQAVIFFDFIYVIKDSKESRPQKSAAPPSAFFKMHSPRASEESL